MDNEEKKELTAEESQIVSICGRMLFSNITIAMTIIMWGVIAWPGLYFLFNSCGLYTPNVLHCIGITAFIEIIGNFMNKVRLVGP